MYDQTPPEEIRSGRRALEGLGAVEILEDLHWGTESDRWVLKCRINIGSSNPDLIPHTTNWYILIPPTYPWGNIKICPAEDGGITKTFPHQVYNQTIQDKPWRNGNICVETPKSSTNLPHLDEEPFEFSKRLKWHVERAIKWIKLASDGELVIEGERFEVPYYPRNSKIIGYIETEETFEIWEEVSEQFGKVDLVYHPDERSGQNTLMVTSFRDKNGEIIFNVPWGNKTDEKIRSLSEKSNLLEKQNGIWIKCREPLVLEPWQAPLTWSELSKAFNQQDLQLFELLKEIAGEFRSQDSYISLAMIGFPIPDYVGEVPCRIYWQPMKFPGFSAEGSQVPDGFRQNSDGYFQRDKQIYFKPQKSIDWVNGENWEYESVVSRGSFSKNLTERNILLIGAGAIGSHIAEILVRAGCKEITILDNDRLEVGNMSRHTLTQKYLNESKTKSLEHHLNEIFSHLDTSSWDKNFLETGKEYLSEFDLIIDCTAEQAVLNHLSKVQFSTPKQICSLSINLHAKNLFVFFSKRESFPHELYLEKMNPWYIRDRERTEDVDFPRDGIGCWHAHFPADESDIALLSSAATKCLENLVQEEEPKFLVFEQSGDEIFEGLKRVQDDFLRK